MQQKSLKKNAFYSFLKAFADLLFPLITFPYASRILSPDGIGKINFSNSITAYFAMLAGLGISTYATREVAKIRENKYEMNKFCKEIITINFISTVFSYSLFFLALFFVPKFQDYNLLLLISSSTILFRTISMSWFTVAIEDFRFITLRSFIFQILSLIFLFVFVRDESDFVAYMIFGIISPIGTNFINFIYAKRFIDFHQKCKLDLRKHLKPIFIFFGMAFVTSIYETLDTTMVGILTTDTEVGYYSAAIKINRMVLALMVAIAGILLPRLSYYAEKQDEEKFKKLVNNSVNMNMLFSIPCSVGLFLLASPLIHTFVGNKYIPSINIMKVMTSIIIIISLSNILGAQILPAVRKEKIAFYSYIAGAFMNILCNSILIPHFGALGAGIATTIAESSVMLIQLIFCIRYVFTPQLLLDIAKNFIQVILASAIMGGGVFVICNVMSENMLLKLLFSVTTGIFLYSAALFILRNRIFLTVIVNMKKKHER